MKKPNFILLAGTFAALFFMGCSTGKKYTNTSFGGGWAEPNAEIKNNTSLPDNSANTTPEVVSPSVEAPVQKTESTTPTTTFNKVAPEKIASKSISEAKSLNVKPTKKPSLKSRILSSKFSKMVKPNQTNEDGVMLILLVILCFIIPPLAYFLAKGTADGWFWLDLILFLIAITYFFGFHWGLAGLASIVIALLGVFDVI